MGIQVTNVHCVFCLGGRTLKKYIYKNSLHLTIDQM